MERELGRLAHRPHEQEQGDGDQHAVRGPSGAHLPEHPAVVKGAEGDKDQHHAQAEAEVAHPVDDEGLLPRGRRLGLVIEEADEVVRAEPDRLPAEVQDEVVPGQHQHEHAEGEQAHIGEEAVVSAIAVHVSHRVDEDQETDPRDDETHDGRELVELEGHRHLKAAYGEPTPQLHHYRLFGTPDLEKSSQRQAERPSQGQDG